jgi:hypothetical protein
MATISFANLDQGFNINDSTVIAFGSYEGYTYSYFSTGGDNLDFFGVSLTDNGTVLTGGTVNTINIDLDGDDFVSPELVISGLSVAATSFKTNVGTADQQRNIFWVTALGGDDVVNFNMAAPQQVLFAGDGAFIQDSALHLGGDDAFVDNGGFALAAGSNICGDYFVVANGRAIGGDDTMTIGAPALWGDFREVSGGGAGVGGDDIITPARLDENVVGGLQTSGDARDVFGALVAGDDLIDLRATDFTGFSGWLIYLAGDASAALADCVVICGDDTIYGSPFDDFISGDCGVTLDCYIEGGKDRLYGYGGNDTISGNEGRDFLSGGDNDDLLNGGLDGDVIDGGLGNDSMIGDTGNDSMTGGDGSDTMVAGAGTDTIDGGTGDDVADAGAGVDNMKGGNGKDSLFGGTGNDAIDGGIGNDTLSGGDNNDALIGAAGFDVLVGGNDNDTLDGGAENDQLYGNAGVDLFVFATGYGTDTIRDFAAGAGLNDFIRLKLGAAFDSFAEVMAVATDNGVDTTFNFGGGNVLIVKGVVVAGFNADDFLYG